MSEKTLHVLLVEDNAGDAELLRQSLRGRYDHDLEIMHAWTMEEGLRASASTPIDVMLLDLSLPDVQGLDGLREVQRRTPSLPVVILTGCDDDRVGLQAVQAGAQDYLVKGQCDGPLLRRAIGYAVQRKRADEQIRRLNVELESRVFERTRALSAANHDLEAFNYSIAHDLRTPLRAVDGYAQRLLDAAPQELSDEHRDFARRIIQGCRRMEQLIDAMLQLSRLARGGLRKEQVSLSKLALEVAEDLREREPDRRIEFTAADDLIVHGDMRLLRALLQNLLENAWKFTRCRPCAVVEFGAANGGGQATFFVRDNGLGFDPATAAGRLFMPFERLHGALCEGVGVGLATVQRIVHRHGGVVWAEGAVDRGATFYFSLGDERTREQRPNRSQT